MESILQAFVCHGNDPEYSPIMIQLFIRGTKFHLSYLVAFFIINKHPEVSGCDLQPGSDFGEFLGVTFLLEGTKT